MLCLASSLLILLEMKCWYRSKATPIGFTEVVGACSWHIEHTECLVYYSHCFWRFAKFHPIDYLYHKQFMHSGWEWRGLLFFFYWMMLSSPHVYVSLCVWFSCIPCGPVCHPSFFLPGYLKMVIFHFSKCHGELDVPMNVIKIVEKILEFLFSMWPNHECIFYICVPMGCCA